MINWRKVLRGFLEIGISSTFTILSSILLLILVTNCGFDGSDKHQRIEKNKQDIKIDSIGKYYHPMLVIPDSVFNINQFEGAIELYKEVLHSFKVENNSDGIIAAEIALGKCNLKLSRFDTAVVHYKIALKYLNETDEGEDLRNAEMYYGLGTCYRFLGNADKSLEYQARSLKIRQRILGDQDIEVASCYIELGNVHRWIRFDYYHAEEFYYKALAIMENQPDTISADLHMFSVLYNLTTTSRLKGDYEKALDYGKNALRLTSKLKSNNEIYQELCNTVIANIYFSKVEYDQAINYYLEAIKLNSGNAYYLINSYINLGLSNVYKGNHIAAINYCDTAYYIIQKEYPDDKKSIGNCYELYGLAFNKLGKPKEAYKYLLKNLGLREKQFGETHRDTRIASRLIASNYRKTGLLDSALYYYQKALYPQWFLKSSDQLANGQIENDPYLVEIIIDKALILMERAQANGTGTGIHDLKIALDCFYLADSVISISKNGFDRDASLLQLIKSSNTMYVEAVKASNQLLELTKDEAYVEDVFYFMEKNKARVLFNHLSETEMYHKVGIPDSIMDLREKLKYEMESEKFLLAKQEQSPDAIDENIEASNSRIYDIGRELEKVKEHLAVNYPNFYQIRYDEQIPELEELKNKADLLNASIIQYAWGDSTIFALGVSGERISCYTIQSVDTIKAAIISLLENLEHGNNLTEKSYRSFVRHAHFLYQKLVEPILANVGKSGADNLYIIPDGILSGLPFEILLTSRGSIREVDYKHLNYLIRDYKIAYAYSMTLFDKYVRTLQRSVKEALLFSYSDKDAQGAVDELPGTYREAKAVASFFNCDITGGEAATKKQFKKRAPGYDILHLAVHGNQGKGDVEQSNLVFHGEDKNQTNNYLYAYELYNLKLKAKLAILSACETGLGKEVKGEGVFSMARAFAYAGCPSMVMSLWKINDKSTSDIIVNFYQELSGKKPLHEAMRNSKLNYLEYADEYTAHPSHWASLIVTGDVSPIQFKNRHFQYYPIILVLIVVAIFWIIIRKNKSV